MSFDTRMSQNIDRAPGRIPLHHVVAVTSQTPDIPPIFWTAYLAQALAEWEKKVLILDIGSDAKQLASALRTPAIHSSLKQLLGRPAEAITLESHAGPRIVTFQWQWSELKRFSPAEREVLIQLLQWEEDQVDVFLINLDPFSIGPEAAPFLRCLSEMVLLVAPDEIRSAYGLLKTLYGAQPDLNAGLIEYGQDPSSVSNGIQRLISASTLFLKKSPRLLGQIAPDLEAFRSEPVMSPLLHPVERGLTLKDIVPISMKIVHDFSGQLQDRLFFKAIKTALDVRP